MMPPLAMPGGTRCWAASDRLLLVLAVFQSADVFGSIMNDLLGFAGSVKVVTGLWLLLYGWGAVRLFQCAGMRWLSWLLRYRLLLVLLMAAVMGSVAWSIDPALTIRRSIHFIGTAIVAVAIGYLIPLRVLLQTLGWTLALLLAGSVIAAVALPALGIQEYEGKLVWKGLFTDKNSLGFAAATTVMLMMVMAWSAVTWRARFLCLAGAVVALVALLGSHSATSLVAMSIGSTVMLLLFVSERLQVNRAGVVSLVVIVTAAAILLIKGVDLSGLFSLLGRSSDLTGRQEVWAAVEYLVAERPWTGTGYGTIWFPTPESEWQQALLNLSWLAHHAHNAFYQTASQLGLPVTALAILFLLQLQLEAIAISLRAPVLMAALLAVGYQTAFLVANVTEAFFMVDRNLFWLLLLALPTALLRHVEGPAGVPAVNAPFTVSPVAWMDADSTQWSRQ